MLRKQRDGLPPRKLGRPKKKRRFRREQKPIPKKFEVVEREEAVSIENLWNFDNLKPDDERVPAEVCSIDIAEKYMKEYLKGIKKLDKFMRGLLSTDGSKQDKISARAMLVQKSPISSLHHVDKMIQIVEGRSRRDAKDALHILVDMFVGSEEDEEGGATIGLLPDDKKLIPFHKRSFPTHGVKKRTLILWYVEDKIKSLYKRLIQVLEQGCYDLLWFFKEPCMELIYRLLTKKPEEENVLMQILVNKFTDQDNVAASLAIKLALQLLDDHPDMSVVMLKEIKTLLSRKNIPKSARFFAIVFFHQMDFNASPEGAGAVGGILLNLFTDHVTKKKALNGKTMTILLRAVVKLFQTSADLSEVQQAYHENCVTLYSFVEDQSFTSAVTTLRFIYTAELSGGKLTNRFYRALYKLMLRAQICNFHANLASNMLLLNLLYEVFKKDRHIGRRLALARRLMQVAVHGPSQFTIAALLVLVNVEDCRSIFDIDCFGTTKSDWEYEPNPVNYEPLRVFTKADRSKQDPDEDAKIEEFPFRWELLLLKQKHWHKAVRELKEMVNPVWFRLMPFLDKWVKAKPRTFALDETDQNPVASLLRQDLKDLDDEPAFEKYYLRDPKELAEERRKAEEAIKKEGGYNLI